MDPDAPPPIPPGVLPAHLHFSRAQVREGDPAPDFTLPLAHGEGTVALSALRGRPVVLVFGSFT
jgi:cytochrome oxidase Cu insertion factor (SCO1/SenC/PrrC family)